MKNLRYNKIVVEPVAVEKSEFRHIFVQAALDNLVPRSTKSMTKTLYFGNLAWAVTNDDLTQAVTQYAEVISARIATDRETGRSRGFGFGEVPSDKAEAVITALNGAEWAGRVLTVNEAKPREDRPRSGGPGAGAGGARRF
jgi:RNA recognition motif-containing protein